MRTRVLLAGLAAALAAPALARADLIVAYDRLVAGNGWDVAMLNLSTGQPVALPAGVNTTADELHPTLSGDGRLLAFQRLTPPAVSAPPADPATPVARQTIVFDRAARSEVQPGALGGGDTTRGAPAIAADGGRVINGAAGDPTRGARVTVTDLASPFAQAPLFTPPGTLLGRSTVNPSIGTGAQPVVAWATRRTSSSSTCSDLAICFFSTVTELRTQDLAVLRFRPGFTGSPQVIAQRTGSDTQAFDHPAVATRGPLGLADVTAFERLGQAQASACGAFGCTSTTVRLAGSGDIDVISASGAALSPAPAGVNTTFDERMPAWSADGRYLAFIRAIPKPEVAGGTPILHDLVLVYDFQTQALVPGMTLDLGRAAALAPAVGNLALAQTPAFQIVCDLSCQRALQSGSLTAGKDGSGAIGLLVQRVAGTHRVLGRRVPRLVTVGRVPLGVQPAGRLRLRWDLRVNGRPLAPGRYRVTFRALFGRRSVRELSRPVILVVTRPG